MNIQTRRVGKYIDIKITVGNTTHDLGLHDREEANSLSSELLSASLEIEEKASNLIDFIYE